MSIARYYLGPRLGPLFVQLPPAFGPDRLDRLAAFLEVFRGPCAVEVRHPAFHRGDAVERRLDDLLAAFGADRAVMDTRPLRAAPDPIDEATRLARARKPDLPVRPIALGRFPMVRYVAHPQVEANDRWLRPWAEVVASWLAEGRTPFFFVHSPGDVEVPAVARRFHALLSRLTPVGEMPAAPPEAAPPPDAQLALL